MFTIKDGKVVAKFDDGEVSLALSEVKLSVEALALIGLQRVSRETVAGLATEDQPKAKAKLLKRWELWKAGTFAGERTKTTKMTAEEVEQITREYFRYVCETAKVKPADIKAALAKLDAKDAEAMAKFEAFKKNNAKGISGRIKEVIKIRKNAGNLTY